MLQKHGKNYLNLIWSNGGLAVLNELENYKSSVLLASYNEILHSCISCPTLQRVISNQGKENYTQDRKIKKDIEEKLYFINGIMLRAKEYILKSNIDRLHEIGNIQFIKMRKAKVEKKHKQVIEYLKKNT